MDDINACYGRGALRVAAEGYDKTWKMKQEFLSHYVKAVFAYRSDEILKRRTIILLTCRRTNSYILSKFIENIITEPIQS